MGPCKRILPLTILMLSCLMLQNAALVGAVAPGGTTYNVYGYVKISGTSTPIPGAIVSIYDDLSNFKGSTTTGGDGYFAKVVTCSRAQDWIKCVVTKSGYQTATKTARPGVGFCNMGTVLMTGLPPLAPTISNDVITFGGPKQVTISWNVAWGTGATTYSSKCYWSFDSTVDESDWTYSYSSSSTQFLANVPQSLLSLSPHTYYYKICALNGNNFGNSPTTTLGPKSSPIQYWIVAPIDDASTYHSDPNGNYNGGTISVTRGDPEDPGCFSGWLKFQVPDVGSVRVATLRAYDYFTGVSGHASIYAYECGTNWEEETITYSNSLFSVQIGSLLATCGSGSSQTWDSWDVTLACNNVFAVHLVPSSTMQTGANYYSKEYGTASLRPYLRVEYYGEKETSPPVTTTFHNDNFKDPTLDSVWTVTTVGSPDWSHQFGYSGLFFGHDVYPVYTHNEPRGYYITQTGLQISGGFDFEMKFGCSLARTPNYQNTWSPSVTFGVELLQEDLWSNPVAAMILHYDSQTYQEYIEGTVGATSQSVTVGSLVLPDSLFRIHREPSNNRITLDWYDHYVLGEAKVRTTVLPIQEQTATIYAVRIKMIVEAPLSSGSFLTSVDFIRFDKLDSLENPLTVPLHDPVAEWGFEPSSLVAWENGETNPPSAAKGVRDGATVYEGSYSWLAQPNEQRWSIVQNLTGGVADAVKGHCLGFSFVAHHSTTASKVKAMIQYTSGNSLTPVCITGSWVTMGPSDPDSWSEVSARTRYVIPSDAHDLRVWIVGVATAQGGTFTGYVDSACLYIINNDAYCGLDEQSNRGVVLMTLSTTDSEKIAGTGYFNILNAMVNVEANSGYVIRRIRVVWEVQGPQAESTGIMEESCEINNQNFYGESPANEAWNSFCAIVGSPITINGLKILSAAFFGTGITMVVGTFLGLVQFLLIPHYRFAGSAQAIPGAGGYWDLSYSTDIPDISYAGLGFQFYWTVDGVNHPYAMPSFRLNAYVEWGTSGTGATSLVTTQSIVLSFDTYAP